MSQPLILYIGEKNVSSWSMRGYLALVHKGLAFEERTISLLRDRDRAERFRVSPTGRVPVLHHGDLVVPDSAAILEYLEETFPPPRYPALWPREVSERVHARWLAAAMHAGFAKLRESMSFNFCFLPQLPDPSRESLLESAEMLGYFEHALSRKTKPGPYLFGAFTGADVMYAPAVVRLTAFRVPTERTPRARDYLQAVLEHEGVKRWMDEARALPPVEHE